MIAFQNTYVSLSKHLCFAFKTPMFCFESIYVLIARHNSFTVWLSLLYQDLFIKVC